MHRQSSPPIADTDSSKVRASKARRQPFRLVCLSAALVVLSCTFGNRLFFGKPDAIYRFRESVIHDLGPREAHRLAHHLFAEADRTDQLPELDILNPYHGAVFPPDMASPEITWEDRRGLLWLIRVSFGGGQGEVCMLTDRTSWIPDRKTWEAIKSRALQAEARITVYGINRESPARIVAANDVAIRFSPDRVTAPVFFQHIPLPFAHAARHPELSQWCLGDIGSYAPPPVVMENLPVCANCHGFSSDGKLFGMDMDIHEDKGAYLLAALEEPLSISPKDFISWNDFPAADQAKSMGLFSQISPDKKTVISTVKELSFFTMIADIDYSQFFFPIKGMLACYDRHDKRFFALPGADLPDYVQTCPAWSPDGKTIVFARAEHDPQLIATIGERGYLPIGPDIRIDDLNRRYRIQFDLYTMPFNNGRGGNAAPLAGASANGKSNYFPRYSPDGKWIVFTQSDTGLAIQPSSRLCIVPASGGKARVLACNTTAMNSWHSWSPNSKWLVFSSKANSPYSQLFLTHIDDQGEATVPVLLSRFSSKNRACLVPEFVNIHPSEFPEIRIHGLLPPHSPIEVSIQK